METNCQHCRKPCPPDMTTCKSCEVKLDKFNHLIGSGAELLSNCCFVVPIPESVDEEQPIYSGGTFYLSGRCSSCKDGAGFEPIPPVEMVHELDQHQDVLPVY